MENSAASKGIFWIKVLGVLTFIGILVAVGRIVLRAFQDTPEPEDEHHEAA